MFKTKLSVMGIALFMFCGYLFLTKNDALAGDKTAHCKTISYKEQDFSVCTSSVDEDETRLFLRGSNDKLYYTFSNLQKELAEQNDKLLFAMNAGMYDANRNPIGLYVENGLHMKTLNLKSGKGNFHMFPNGVFAIGKNGVFIQESVAFQKENHSVNYATQSGPMLVIDGALHSRFKPKSTSKYIRNGVGVRGKTLYFVVSNEPVNFHMFAGVFKHVLKTPNALYLDGAISKLYAPELNRHDIGRAMGPIIGVVSKGKASD